MSRRNSVSRHHESVLIGRAIDEVIRQISPGLRHRPDVVDGQIELLERERAHLPDHAGDELVGSFRKWMPLRPRREAFGALLDAQEAVGVQAQRS